MQSFRTFVAIALPKPLVRDLAALIERHRGDGDGVKWVPHENLHLTLKFLGDVDNVDTAEVCDVAADAVAEIGPFEVQIGGTGTLPSLQKARTLVARVDDPSGHLVKIVAGLEDRYAAIGFRRESRDYVPHITLGRARGGSRRIDAEVIDRWMQDATTEHGPLVIDSIRVVASFLDKAGPTYQTLTQIQLE